MKKKQTKKQLPIYRIMSNGIKFWIEKKAECLQSDDKIMIDWIEESLPDCCKEERTWNYGAYPDYFDNKNEARNAIEVLKKRDKKLVEPFVVKD